MLFQNSLALSCFLLLFNTNFTPVNNEKKLKSYLYLYNYRRIFLFSPSPISIIKSFLFCWFYSSCLLYNFLAITLATLGHVGVFIGGCQMSWNNQDRGIIDMEYRHGVIYWVVNSIWIEINWKVLNPDYVE